MLPDLVTLGARWTLVGGKGGVGKTTTAAALAVALADRGESVLALSTDPAHSLGDALGVELGPEAREIPGVPGLRALEVDAAHERESFLATRRGALLLLLERGTYLARDDVAGLAELSVPGLDELAALSLLIELARDGAARLVVDTAPTGHTLRLLELPRLARDWLAALHALDDRHRTVAVALAGGYAPDEVTDLLRGLDADLRRIADLLHDPAHTRFLLVTTPEPGVVAETLRYQDALAASGIALAGVAVNRADPAVGEAARGAGMVFLPRLPADPRGPDALRRFAAAAALAPPAATPPGAKCEMRSAKEGRALRTSHPALRTPFVPPLDRRLYLVGGKGGVGKSTVAAALAVLLARETGGPTLLLSVDPAGSLGEVLGAPVGDEPTPVAGAPGLAARQADAPAAWERFRREYREETERLFSGLLGGSLSASADREVAGRLVDLAPPGIDELLALLELVDVLEDRSYNALVLDTAPTGHLLRLLEMPALALEWTHALLRLLLRYREVVGLGSVAERVLALSRSLRGLRELLSDPARCWTLAVALPEALSVPETRRLLARLRALGIEPGALLVNRLGRGDAAPEPGEEADHARALLEIDPRLPAAAAPALPRGPVGAAELLSFAAAWRRLPA